MSELNLCPKLCRPLKKNPEFYILSLFVRKIPFICFFFGGGANAPCLLVFYAYDNDGLCGQLQRYERDETWKRQFALGVGSGRRWCRRHWLQPSEVDRNRHTERRTINGQQSSGAWHQRLIYEQDWTRRSLYVYQATFVTVKPNTHRWRLHDSTVELSRVGRCILIRRQSWPSFQFCSQLDWKNSQHVQFSIFRPNPPWISCEFNTHRRRDSTVESRLRRRWVLAATLNPSLLCVIHCCSNKHRFICIPLKLGTYI